MNPDEQYEINRGNTEFPAWENAHWEAPAHVAGFHRMRIDSDRMLVVKHEGAIRSLKPNTAALESALKAMLAHKDLTPDAKKLLEAVIEAQATGEKTAIGFLDMSDEEKLITLRSEIQYHRRKAESLRKRAEAQDRIADGKVKIAAELGTPELPAVANPIPDGQTAPKLTGKSYAIPG